MDIQEFTHRTSVSEGLGRRRQPAGLADFSASAGTILSSSRNSTTVVADECNGHHA